jgi:protocatechuate 3,4-dioxygenase beta subunit
MDLTKSTFAGLIFTVTVFAPLLCAQSTGSISGRITNILTGAGIEGVKVRAACLPGGSTRCRDAGVTAVSDTAGAFHLSALPDARYLMSIEKDGFSWSESGLHIATVSAAGDTHFDLKLTPLASLHGRVVDPDGKPVAGITVQSGLGPTAITDDQGAFAFKRLNPSTYQLLAKVKPQADGKDGERLVSTYFPSAIYAEQAVKIEVQGVDLSGYEIRLRTAPARAVRGVVLDADGKPGPHASVELSKSATPGLIPIIRGAFAPLRAQAASTASDHADSDAEGAFEFAAVLEGDWIVKGRFWEPSRRHHRGARGPKRHRQCDCPHGEAIAH